MKPPYDVELLERIYRGNIRGLSPRPPKTPERDRLQALGLIETHSNPLGDERKPYWRTTPKGDLEAKTNRREGLVE